MRCQREHLNCIYSSQKPMGRPKKRQRQQDPHNDSLDGVDDAVASSNEIFNAPFPEFDYHDLSSAEQFNISDSIVTLWPEGANTQFEALDSSLISLAMADNDFLAP